MAFNPEDLIRWEELSDSLQERFRNVEASINAMLGYYTGLNNEYRVTISEEPPLHPEPDRDIWVDLVHRVIRFYMSRNNNGSYDWEFTRAAWYGGSSSDVGDIVNALPVHNYSRLKSLIWISNKAYSNGYSSANEDPRSDKFVCSVNGWYRMQDRTMLFEYNKQFNYTHDGGKIHLHVDVERKENSYSPQLVYDVIYDSNPTSGYPYRAFSNGCWPEVPIHLKDGDRLISYVDTLRDPLSTDDVQIRQITSVQIYRLNAGSYGDRIDTGTEGSGY